MPSTSSAPIARSRSTVASNAAASTASKPTATASFAGPGSHHDPLGPVVVAPGARVAGRLAGNEADDVGQHGRERVGVRELEDEVGELDLVVHRRGPLGGGHRPAASRGKSRSVFARSASVSEPGGSPAASSRSPAISTTKSGVNGKSLP